MSFRSLALPRCALSLAAVLVVSACSDTNRAVPLSQVTPIDIPAADVDNQINTNINNPTLTVPQTFQVSDGDLLTLVWSDEFDGAQLDPEVWFYESGDGTQYGIPFPSWGNNELQYYLPDNVQLDNGVLQITARRESADGYNFTSGRINTQDRFAFKYGRIEASIKFPSGQGLWPAFWMLSQDSPYGEWAATGEIDIVEAVNLDGTGGNEIFSTIHFGGEASINQNLSTETRYTPSFDVTEDFHTYAFEWDEFKMRWYVDGTLTMVENSWSSTAAPPPAPFDQPFHILFNLAVGGDFPGSPDGSTPFPATMEVDWVRVYSG
ncbi:MAG: glycoside hydrolase family 16 protein, partial [Gammaproteobacteria bacterium]|nr:glycoside hydrolase family 16 protein [Gammaproteobacteria bacterium]